MSNKPLAIVDALYSQSNESRLREIAKAGSQARYYLV